jgi:hypothetical protein
MLTVHVTSSVEDASTGAPVRISMPEKITGDPMLAVQPIASARPANASIMHSKISDPAIHVLTGRKLPI